MKHVLALLFASSLFLFSASAQLSITAEQPRRQESIEELIQEALLNNPDIAAESHKAESIRQRITLESSLPDPQLTFKMMEIPGTEFGKARFANLELMQMVTFPAKLATKRELATLQHENSLRDRSEVALDLIASLKSEVAELLFQREALRINHSNQDLMRRILKASETSSMVGLVPQQDVLKASIELSKLAANEAAVQSRIASAEESLKALLNRRGDETIGDILLPGSRPALPSLGRMLSFARSTRPLLTQDSLMIVEKELAVRLMEQEYIPDFKFSLEYVRMPVALENRWSFSAGITVPFAPWSLAKGSARVQEAEAEKLMRQSKYVAARNLLDRNVTIWYLESLALRAQLETYEQSVLPQLRQSIDLSLTDYENGRMSYVMLMDGYRTYNEMLLEIAMTTRRYYEAVAALEREVGAADLHSIPDAEKEIKK